MVNNPPSHLEVTSLILDLARTAQNDIVSVFLSPAKIYFKTGHDDSFHIFPSSKVNSSFHITS